MSLAHHCNNNFTCGCSVSSSQTFEFPSNLTCSGPQHAGLPAIKIIGDNAVVDLRGMTIQGRIGYDEGDYYGMFVEPGLRNITIRNGIIDGFYEGIYVYGMPDAYVENVFFQDLLFRNQFRDSAFVDYTWNMTMDYCFFEGNNHRGNQLDLVQFYFSHHVTVQNSNFTVRGNNTYAIQIESTENFVVDRTVFSFHSIDGKGLEAEIPNLAINVYSRPNEVNFTYPKSTGIIKDSCFVQGESGVKYAHGIRLHNHGGEEEGEEELIVTIQNCLFQALDIAVHMAYSYYTVVINNCLVENQVGIEATYAANATILGNSFSQNVKNIRPDGFGEGIQQDEKAAGACGCIDGTEP